MRFLVDIPNSISPDAEWVQIADFDTREEAIAYVRRLFGADEEGRVQLISEIDEDFSEEDPDGV